MLGQALDFQSVGQLAFLLDRKLDFLSVDQLAPLWDFALARELLVTIYKQFSKKTVVVPRVHFFHFFFFFWSENKKNICATQTRLMGYVTVAENPLICITYPCQDDYKQKLYIQLHM